MTTIVSLIGHQPTPNLLPIRYFDEIDAAILVHTSFTKNSSDRLARLVQRDLKEISSFPVDAYAIKDIQKTIKSELVKKDLKSGDLIFNITGGTKPMSLAAYLVAAEMKADFIYLQSQGSRSLLYHYRFEDQKPVLIKPVPEELPTLITIDDYLCAHVGSYKLTGFAKNEPGRSFERAIYDVLNKVVDEIVVGAKLMGALDVDFVVRCENQVGIIEAKTGGGVKKGLDQLNTAGGQQYLGTYTKKFLISNQKWDHTRSNLKELANARRIQVIELPDYDQGEGISAAGAKRLSIDICKALGRDI